MVAFLEIFFSWVGGFVNIGLEIQAGYLGSPQPGWPLIKCIKLQQRSAVLRLQRFQPSQFTVLPPALFIRF